MDRRGSTSVPAGDRMALRETPRRCLKAAADGRRPRRTPPSSGRRARRRRRSGLDRRARRRLDRASRPRPRRSVARNAATATRCPRDRPSDPRSLRETSRRTAAWTHRRRRGPPSDQRSLPPVSRRQASSSRPRRGPRPGRTERRGPGMSMRRARDAQTDRRLRRAHRRLGTPTGRWRRRHRIRWTFPGPCRRLGGGRRGPMRPRGRDLSDPRRSGGRGPSGPSGPWPCPHPTGGPQPRRSTPRSCPRLGVGGGLGWWPWCWRWPW